jgi:hypothetical protein
MLPLAFLSPTVEAGVCEAYYASRSGWAEESGSPISSSVFRLDNNTGQDNGQFGRLPQRFDLEGDTRTMLIRQ